MVAEEGGARTAARPRGGGAGYAAVDDVDLDGAAVVGAASPCRAFCQFDADFCGWTNDDAGDDDFDWCLGRGSRRDATGPKRDRSAAAPAMPSRGYAFIVSDSFHNDDLSSSISIENRCR